MQELHNKVVCQYQKAYGKLPPLSAAVDGLYWYRFLPHHMARAGLSKVTCVPAAHRIHTFTPLRVINQQDVSETNGLFLLYVII